jgi:hypothetical protein
MSAQTTTSDRGRSPGAGIGRAAAGIAGVAFIAAAGLGAAWLAPAAIGATPTPTPTAAPVHGAAQPAAVTAFTSHVFASGAKITHDTGAKRAAIADPDDITELGGHIFVGFQNGVGPQGQASTTGNRASTIVEFSRAGRRLATWDVVGKCDGLSADPALGQVIATVNEDAHSSLYLITPTAGSHPVHYHYANSLPSDGGTDAIDAYDGMILISASAPGTTGASAPQRGYPAVYRVTLHTATRTASIRGLFSDEATATVANAGADTGSRVALALTDPDSNETVPAFAHRFGGDFMLTSQGDMEQIFVAHAGAADQTLSVLKLTNSVDDTAWPADRTGTLYVTDNGNDTIYRITGPFARGSELVAVTPCDANDAPATCPAPGFPANYLGKVDPQTGTISPVTVHGPAVAVAAQGMLFAG